MVLSIKATYNGETRRFSTKPDDTFPTYQALADQVRSALTFRRWKPLSPDNADRFIRLSYHILDP